MENGKWVLTHGCHNGTLMSRDVGYPYEFDTKEEAMTKFYDLRKGYKSMRYMIWFANLTSPDGTMEILEQNPYD